MSAPIILVTGANGQVGKELRELSTLYSDYRFVFLSREDCPLHHFPLVESFFEAYKPHFCINAAAYTAVDKAETEADMAMLVNGESVGVLATICEKYQTKLVHISTDYVFDGSSEIPYKETDTTGPTNVYGKSKLEGENRCVNANPSSIIIRTAWVYSFHGNNFVKTMLRLMKERPSLNVVSDQIGAPTYAADLADSILKIISSGTWVPGIYHYSNKGKISWFDFATEIKKQAGLQCELHAIPSSAYPTPAKRPAFSLLNTAKIEETYHLTIPDWKASLKRCMKRLMD